MTNTTPERRTKRRYAHEIYPHPNEFEIQPLEQAVPYLYALAIGLEVKDTDWFDLGWDRERQEVSNRAEFLLTTDRTMRLIDARRVALHADALLQGLSGTEAWEWVEERAQDETGELGWERAVHYGVPVDQIKPYPVLDEVGHHTHMDPPDARGWRTCHRIEGRESDCLDCTEPVPAEEDQA